MNDILTPKKGYFFGCKIVKIQLEITLIQTRKPVLFKNGILSPVLSEDKSKPLSYGNNKKARSKSLGLNPVISEK